ncbi:MAG: hypothetical protein RLZZ271_394 [Pseudomonadota bacterium]|jgi:hypothetical protein
MNASTNPAPALSIAGLETVYDQLATAIDQAAQGGEGKTELFLVKLALMNANALASPELFARHIEVALGDL